MIGHDVANKTQNYRVQKPTQENSRMFDFCIRFTLGSQAFFSSSNPPGASQNSGFLGQVCRPCVESRPRLRTKHFQRVFLPAQSVIPVCRTRWQHPLRRRYPAKNVTHRGLQRWKKMVTVQSVPVQGKRSRTVARESARTIGQKGEMNVRRLLVGNQKHL